MGNPGTVNSLKNKAQPQIGVTTNADQEARMRKAASMRKIIERIQSVQNEWKKFDEDFGQIGQAKGNTLFDNRSIILEISNEVYPAYLKQLDEIFKALSEGKQFTFQGQAHVFSPEIADLALSELDLHMSKVLAQSFGQAGKQIAATGDAFRNTLIMAPIAIMAPALAAKVLLRAGASSALVVGGTAAVSPAVTLSASQAVIIGAGITMGTGEFVSLASRDTNRSLLLALSSGDTAAIEAACADWRGNALKGAISTASSVWLSSLGPQVYGAVLGNLLSLTNRTGAPLLTAAASQILAATTSSVLVGSSYTSARVVYEIVQTHFDPKLTIEEKETKMFAQRDQLFGDILFNTILGPITFYIGQAKQAYGKSLGDAIPKEQQAAAKDLSKFLVNQTSSNLKGASPEAMQDVVTLRTIYDRAQAGKAMSEVEWQFLMSRFQAVFGTAVKEKAATQELQLMVSRSGLDKLMTAEQKEKWDDLIKHYGLLWAKDVQQNDAVKKETYQLATRLLNLPLADSSQQEPKIKLVENDPKAKNNIVNSPSNKKANNTTDATQPTSRKEDLAKTPSSASQTTTGKDLAGIEKYTKGLSQQKLDQLAGLDANQAKLFQLLVDGKTSPSSALKQIADKQGVKDFAIANNTNGAITSTKTTPPVTSQGWNSNNVVGNLFGKKVVPPARPLEPFEKIALPTGGDLTITHNGESNKNFDFKVNLSANGNDLEFNGHIEKVKNNWQITIFHTRGKVNVPFDKFVGHGTQHIEQTIRNGNTLSFVESSGNAFHYQVTITDSTFNFQLLDFRPSPQLKDEIIVKQFIAAHGTEKKFYWPLDAFPIQGKSKDVGGGKDYVLEYLAPRIKTQLKEVFPGNSFEADVAKNIAALQKPRAATKPEGLISSFARPIYNQDGWSLVIIQQVTANGKGEQIVAIVQTDKVQGFIDTKTQDITTRSQKAAADAQAVQNEQEAKDADKLAKQQATDARKAQEQEAERLKKQEDQQADYEASAALAKAPPLEAPTYRLQLGNDKQPGEYRIVNRDGSSDLGRLNAFELESRELFIMKKEGTKWNHTDYTVKFYSFGGTYRVKVSSDGQISKFYTNRYRNGIERIEGNANAVNATHLHIAEIVLGFVARDSRATVPVKANKPDKWTQYKLYEVPSLRHPIHGDSQLKETFFQIMKNTSASLALKQEALDNLKLSSEGSEILIEETDDVINWSNLDLSGLCFQSINLNGANFTNANLTGATFSHCDLQFANFNGANLTRAEFRGGKYKDTDFSNANLSGATFEYLGSKPNEGYWFKHNGKFQRNTLAEHLKKPNAEKFVIANGTRTNTQAVKHEQVPPLPSVGVKPQIPLLPSGQNDSRRHITIKEFFGVNYPIEQNGNKLRITTGRHFNEGLIVYDNNENSCSRSNTLGYMDNIKEGFYVQFLPIKEKGNSIEEDLDKAISFKVVKQADSRLVLEPIKGKIHRPWLGFGDVKVTFGDTSTPAQAAPQGQVQPDPNNSTSNLAQLAQQVQDKIDALKHWTEGFKISSENFAPNATVPSPQAVTNPAQQSNNRVLQLSQPFSLTHGTPYSINGIQGVTVTKLSATKVSIKTGSASMPYKDGSTFVAPDGKTYLIAYQNSNLTIKEKSTSVQNVSVNPSTPQPLPPPNLPPANRSSSQPVQGNSQTTSSQEKQNVQNFQEVAPQRKFIMWRLLTVIGGATGLIAGSMWAIVWAFHSLTRTNSAAKALLESLTDEELKELVKNLENGKTIDNKPFPTIGLQKNGDPINDNDKFEGRVTIGNKKIAVLVRNGGYIINMNELKALSDSELLEFFDKLSNGGDNEQLPTISFEINGDPITDNDPFTGVVKAGNKKIEVKISSNKYSSFREVK